MIPLQLFFCVCGLAARYSGARCLVKKGSAASVHTRWYSQSSGSPLSGVSLNTDLGDQFVDEIPLDDATSTPEPEENSG